MATCDNCGATAMPPRGWTDWTCAECGHTQGDPVTEGSTRKSTRQCEWCSERVEGLCAQDTWGKLKTHVSEKHGKKWDDDAREWVETGGS